MKMRSWSISWSIVLTLAFVQAAPGGPGTNEPAPKPAAKAGLVRKVNVDEFEKLWQDKKNFVLDVRSKKEFEAGHIPGAMNLDIKAADFDQKIAELQKDRVYLVHCAAGVRSARACDKMSRGGFPHLIDLAPGFKGWERAGKQIEK